MVRFIVVALVTIVIGALLGWGTFLSKINGFQERFERKPLAMPGKAGVPISEMYRGADSSEMQSAATAAMGGAGGGPGGDDSNGGAAPEGSSESENVVESQSARAEIVNGATHDFGTMRRRSEKTHTFIVRNIGKSPLTLNVEHTTCKCTIGTLEKATLAPGEETGIKLSWKAESLQREFGQTAEIRTNDPTQTLIKLNVRGFVVDSLVFEPAQLNLSEFTNTEELTRTVKMYSFVEEPLDVKLLEWSETATADKVKLDWSPAVLEKDKDGRFADAHHVIDVKITLLPGFRQGNLSTYVRLTTTYDDAIGVAELDVKGRGVGVISIIGGPSYNADLSTLNIGRVKQSEGRTVKLFLNIKGPNRTEMKPVVQKVVPEGALNVTLGEPRDMENSRRYELFIEVPKDGPLTNRPGTAGDNFGKIILKTESEFAQEVPIYYRLVVEK